VDLPQDDKPSPKEDWLDRYRRKQKETEDQHICFTLPSMLALALAFGLAIPGVWILVQFNLPPSSWGRARGVFVAIPIAAYPVWYALMRQRFGGRY